MCYTHVPLLFDKPIATVATHGFIALYTENGLHLLGLVVRQLTTPPASNWSAVLQWKLSSSDPASSPHLWLIV